MMAALGSFLKGLDVMRASCALREYHCFSKVFLLLRVEKLNHRNRLECGDGNFDSSR